MPGAHGANDSKTGSGGNVPQLPVFDVFRAISGLVGLGTMLKQTLPRTQLGTRSTWGATGPGKRFHGVPGPENFKPT